MLVQDIKSIKDGRVITYDSEPDSWIGVDLDATLAEYHGFKGQDKIGKPIPKIVDYVKMLIDRGEKVKIFTARVDGHPEAVSYIQQWLQDVGLPVLEVTNIKDSGMKYLIDDRVRQVEPNTGKFVADGGPGSGIKGHKTFHNEIESIRTSKKVFQTKAPIPLIQQIIEDPEYYKKNKGMTLKFSWISPQQYLRLSAEAKNTTTSQELQNASPELVEKYSKEMSNYLESQSGKKFPSLWIEKARGNQEGRHRALAAIKSGISRVPVYQIFHEKEVKQEKQPALRSKGPDIELPKDPKDVDALMEFLGIKTHDSIVGSTTFQGLRIGIENPKGSIRKGTDEDGEKWKTKMFYPYGFIKNTEGVDGDEIDCFVGPNSTAPFVYIIRLKDQDHEDKVMLGFPTKEHARDAFCAHYDQPEEHLGQITEMKMEDFKKSIQNHKKGTRIG